MENNCFGKEHNKKKECLNCKVKHSCYRRIYKPKDKRYYKNTLKQIERWCDKL